MLINVKEPLRSTAPKEICAVSLAENANQMDAASECVFPLENSGLSGAGRIHLLLTLRTEYRNGECGPLLSY